MQTFLHALSASIMLLSSASVATAQSVEEAPDWGHHPIELAGKSIGYQYSWKSPLANTLPPVTLAVKCPIFPNGKVVLSRCDEIDEINKDAARSLQIAGHLGRFENPPGRADDLGDDGYPYSFVRLSLAIPAIEPMELDLSSGPLVEVQDVRWKISNAELAGYYPSAAIVRGIEAVLTVECQIQSDTSIVCRTLAVEPEEHARVFRRVARNMTRYIKMGETLKDGTSSVGVRFQTQLKFVNEK